MVVSINGEFYARVITGIERVARESVNALDELLAGDEIKIELVVPKNAIDLPALKNIVIVTLDYEIKFFPYWTQIIYQKYIIKNNRLSLDFTNVTPYFKPGIAYIHDIYAVLYKNDYQKSFRDRLVALYSKLMYKTIAKRAKAVITVSEFSKKTIIEKYKINFNRVTVIYPGCNLANKSCDNNILKKHPELKKGQFYFTLGSLQKRKNLKWIIAHAKIFSNEIFAISGKAINTNSVEFGELPSNIIFLGYLSDSQVRALFASCKAFVFPSYFEGFGLPPLEALSMGSKIIIARSSSLVEIYKDCAHYIEPDNPNINLDELLKEKVATPGDLLQKYTFKNTAQKLLAVIGRYM